MAGSTITCSSPPPAPTSIFHRTISDFLFEWSRATRTTGHEIVVVGRSFTAHTIRSQPVAETGSYTLLTPESEEGRTLLEQAGQPADGPPIVRIREGPILVDPTL